MIFARSVFQREKEFSTSVNGKGSSEDSTDLVRNETSQGRCGEHVAAVDMQALTSCLKMVYRRLELRDLELRGFGVGTLLNT